MANRIEMKGVDELLKKLAHLGSRSTARRVQRKAIRAGTVPMLQSVKSNCPRDKGDLRRAQTKKIIVNNFRSQGIVGANEDYVGEDGSKPAHYDHLVERGHVSKEGNVTPPNPFMHRSADESQAAAQEKYAEKLASEYEVEAVKGGK